MKTLLFLLSVTSFGVAAAEIHDAPVTGDQPGIVQFETGNGPVVGPNTPFYSPNGQFPDLLVRLGPDDQQQWTEPAQDDLDAYLYDIKHSADPVDVTVLFDTNKTEILSDEDLAKIAQSEKKNPGTIVSVTGYTDAVGGNGEHNWKLSTGRADAVRQELIGQGVPPNMIKTFGRGPGNPVSDNSTPEGRALNRRANVSIEPEGGPNGIR